MKYINEHYSEYVKILEEELIPAMGCTEPIAIAYGASLLKDTLEVMPDKLIILVSGNILKNVKSVTVPNTNGMHGIDVAAAIGIVAGNSSKLLEVISEVSNEQIDLLKEYLNKTQIEIKHSDDPSALYIELIGYYQDNYARVIIKDSHTFVNLIEKNNKVIYQNDHYVSTSFTKSDKSVLSIKGIVEFADKVKIEDIKKVIGRQIKYNMAICEEGLKNNYGANIGKVIMKYESHHIIPYARGLAAAGSDARMNGCDMPVVINSGSGNQGITTSVPVIAYAKEFNLSEDLLYRALVVSNLVTIHIKNSIGKLSAFCGVVIAGAGCGAGIAYLNGGKYEEISHTIVNTLANISGVVCDGAKSSCAAKIASAVEAGFLGYYMYKDRMEFYHGDGIVQKGVEETIKAIGRIASIGMCETDKEIIQIMIDEKNADN